MALLTVVLDLSIVGEMRVITEEDMAEIPWPLRRAAMISARKIDGRTEEKTVVLIVRRIGSPIAGKIAAKIGNLTDEKIEGKIVSSTGVRIVRLIDARIIAPMQAVNSVGLIGPIRWPANMGVKDERMPA